jgi:hypothetical protein
LDEAFSTSCGTTVRASDWIGASGDSGMTALVLWDRASRLIVSNAASEIPRIREVAR